MVALTPALPLAVISLYASVSSDPLLEQPTTQLSPLTAPSMHITANLGCCPLCSTPVQEQEA